MTVKLAIVMDPISAIKYKKDSSLAMLWAAKAKGWQLHYLEMSDLYCENGVAYGNAAPLTVFEDEARWFELGEAKKTPA